MKLFLCGDISPTEENNHLFAQGDVQTLFADTAELFCAADYSIVNLECALTDTPTPIEKIGPAIAASPNTAQVLARLGVTHCGLSNNHIYDHGPQGIHSTLAALEGARLGYTGFGRDLPDSQQELVLTKGAERICLIAVCEHEYSYALPHRMGSRPFDPFETPLQIRAAKARYDRVVVLYHGGKEQCEYPSPRLYGACHAMAKSGADLILCQHSHCIGCYEIFEGCHILYGQGNFHFVKRAKAEDAQWQSGLGVYYDSELGEVEFVPVVNAFPGIRLADDTEGQAIMDGLSLRSQSLQDGSWRDRWHSYCEAHRERYTKVLANAFGEAATPRRNEMFAHYLDCEAHQDMWRELFPTYNHTTNR